MPQQGREWKRVRTGTARASPAELSSEMYIYSVVVTLNVAPCPFLSCRFMVMSISDNRMITQCSLPYSLCRDTSVFFFFQHKHGVTASVEPLPSPPLAQHMLLVAAESLTEELIAGTMDSLSGEQKALRSTQRHMLPAVLLPQVATQSRRGRGREMLKGRIPEAVYK